MANLDLASEPPPLAATDHFDVVAGDDFEVHHGRGVVLGVLAGAGRVGQHRGAQRVVRVGVGAAHAFVDHLLDAHGRVRPSSTFMPTLMKTMPMPVSWQIGRWPSAAMRRVGQDLRDRVLGGRGFLALVGFAQGLDVVQRVVVADVLEGVGDGLDQVFLFDGGHAQISRDQWCF